MESCRCESYLLPALLDLSNILQGYPEGRLGSHSEHQCPLLYCSEAPVAAIDGNLLFLRSQTGVLSP
jgi:hypothetical protein